MQFAVIGLTWPVLFLVVTSEMNLSWRFRLGMVLAQIVGAVAFVAILWWLFVEHLWYRAGPWMLHPWWALIFAICYLIAGNVLFWLADEAHVEKEEDELADELSVHDRPTRS